MYMVSWLWGCQWKGIRWLEYGYNWKVKPTKLAGVLGSGWERKKRVKTGLLVLGLNNWKDEMAIYRCGDGRGGDANGRKWGILFQSCYISQSIRDLIEDVKQAVEYASLELREKTVPEPDILEIICRWHLKPQVWMSFLGQERKDRWGKGHSNEP